MVYGKDDASMKRGGRAVAHVPVRTAIEGGGFNAVHDARFVF